MTFEWNKKRKHQKKKSREQKNALYNIKMLYEARNKVIKFYDDYSLMVSEALKKQDLKY